MQYASFRSIRPNRQAKLEEKYDLSISVQVLLSVDNLGLREIKYAMVSKI